MLSLVDHRSTDPGSFFFQGTRSVLLYQLNFQISKKIYEVKLFDDTTVATAFQRTTKQDLADPEQNKRTPAYIPEAHALIRNMHVSSVFV
jgi:hypothetical protein